MPVYTAIARLWQSVRDRGPRASMDLLLLFLLLLTLGLHDSWPTRLLQSEATDGQQQHVCGSKLENANPKALLMFNMKLI